jgi:hypothetical protein
MSLEHSLARQGGLGQPREKSDLLVGAKRIAEYLNATERQVYHWAATKQFKSFFKIGDKIAACRADIDEDLARFKAGEAA